MPKMIKCRICKAKFKPTRITNVICTKVKCKKANHLALKRTPEYRAKVNKHRSKNKEDANKKRKAWRAKPGVKAKEAEQQHNAYHKNLEESRKKSAEQTRKWYKNNTKAKKASDKKYYNENKEKYLENGYRHRHGETADIYLISRKMKIKIKEIKNGKAKKKTKCNEASKVSR